jgi:hypothetical protein
MNFKTPGLLLALALLAHPSAQADEFDIPPQVVEKFAREFQDALAKRDVDRVATLVKFPLRINTNMALNLAPFGRWTLRDKAAQRRLALRDALSAEEVIGDTLCRHKESFVDSDSTSGSIQPTPCARV